MQSFRGKWPILEQVFFSEEPDWLANSKGKESGSHITVFSVTTASPPVPPTPTPNHSQSYSEQSVKILSPSQGFWKHLRRENGAVEEEKRGRGPSGWTQIYACLDFQ